MFLKVVRNCWIIIIIFMGIDAFENWKEGREKNEEAIGRVDAFKKKIDQKKKNLKKRESSQLSIDKLKEEIDSAKKRTAEIVKQLPREIDDAKAIGVIKRVASRVRVNFSNVRPLNEEVKKYFVVKRYGLEGRGSYPQFVSFMKQVDENRAFYFNVRSVNFTRPNERQRGRHQVVNSNLIVEIYKSKKGVRKERGIEDIQKNHRKRR